MLTSIGIVLGTYVLAVALLWCTDPLLSGFFPGNFARKHVPSNGALASKHSAIHSDFNFLRVALRSIRARKPRESRALFFDLSKQWALLQRFQIGTSDGC